MERAGWHLPDALAGHRNDPIVIPAVVWAELLIWVRLSKTPGVAAKRRAQLEHLRLHVPIVEFSPAIAEHYADICAESAAAAQPIPQNDIEVAATARHFGYTVLVGQHDEPGFRQVGGLSILAI